LVGYHFSVGVWDQFVSSARAHEAVLGLVLSGSRGRGVAHANADWDCYVIVDAPLEERDAFGSTDASLDASVMTLEQFREYAAPGTPSAWDAYAFAHVEIVHDGLGGEIASIAAAKEFLPDEVADRNARGSLDAFVNLAVRRAKSDRDAQREAAVLDAAASIECAIETLFAMEQRVRPYNRYLGWELERHPLVLLPSDVALPEMLAAVASGTGVLSAALFKLVERSVSESGIRDVIEAWDPPALALARGVAAC
jgi:hypothetical protein